jgi:phosphate transport system substrate-binding protein
MYPAYSSRRSWQNIHLSEISSATALKFFDWDYKRASNVAIHLGYVPMPGNVIALIERVWAEKINSGGGAPVFRR